MKVSKVYEVWVGGDMIDDMMDYNTAIKLAEDEFKKEQEQEDPAEVVLDEHSYIEIESLEDFNSVGAEVRVTHFGEDYGKVQVDGAEYEVPLGLAKALSKVAL